MSSIADTSDLRLRDRAIARSLPLMPRRLVRRFSAPYIAGEQLGEAIETVRGLGEQGMGSTLDVLGEAITRREEAVATRDAYLAALDALAELGDPNLVNVSVKLTALGLGIDDRLPHDLTRDIVERAGELGGFVRIDMEDSPWTDETLAVHRALWDAGHRHVGVVIQAYLRRSRADVETLAADGVPVRVVKGIYIEPESIAYRDMRVINRSFVELARILGEAGCRAAYATHDEMLIFETRRLVEQLGLEPGSYEYQMLLGVRSELRDEIVRDGHPMRVYVPYGEKWYEYSLRRLRENPRIAGHVAGGVIESMGRRVGITRRRPKPPANW